MWGDEQELPTGNVTINELEQLAEKLAMAREEYDKAKFNLSQMNIGVEEIESQMMALLAKADLDKYPSKSGTVSRVMRETIRLPQDIESKRLLFKYLQDRGIFEELVSVNSHTLNSFYKSEKKEALENGNFDFKLPGIGEPARQEILSFRKK